MRIKKIIFLIVGVISLFLGSIGIFLPILPTVPFYLLTVFCFSQSSEKLHNWFIGTNLYKKNLASYVQKKGMTKKTKFGILLSVTLLMGFGIVMMMRKALIIPCMIVGIVWIGHVIYFIWGVKTVK